MTTNINGITEELRILAEKISSLEMDSDEHRLVLAALSPLPESRRCFRKIGGILIESDVKNTLPALSKRLQEV